MFLTAVIRTILSNISIKVVIKILVSGFAHFLRFRVVISVIHLFKGIFQLVHLSKSFDLIIPVDPFVTVENVMLEHEYEVEEHREDRKQELNNIEARI